MSPCGGLPKLPPVLREGRVAKDRDNAVLAMGAAEWGLLLVLAVIWGSSFLFFKVLVEVLPPMSVALGRVGISALVLNVWLLLRRDAMPASPRLWLSFLVLGALNNALPFSLIALGETRIPIGLASILNATTPLFTILVAHVWTVNEKLTAAKLFGVFAGLAGAVVIVGPTALSGLGHGNLLGEAACLLASVSYGFGVIYGKRFKGLPAIKVATGQITGATIVLVPLVLLFDRPWTLPMPGVTVWGAMLCIALLCTVVAYILYFRILAVSGATNVQLVTFLVPGTALLLGWLLLGEAITIRELGGMALIGLGLAAIDGRLFKALNVRAAAP